MVRAEDDIDSPLSEMFRLFAAEYMEKGEVAEIKERLPELLDYVERTYKGIKQKTMKRARELVNQLGKGDEEVLEESQRVIKKLDVLENWRSNLKAFLRRAGGGYGTESL